MLAFLGGLLCLLLGFGLPLSFRARSRRVLVATMGDEFPDGPGAVSLLGSSTGLNQRSRGPTTAILHVGPEVIAVGRVSDRMFDASPEIEMFRRSELLGVSEAGIRLGLLLIRTPRGDVDFTVRPENLDELRVAYLAIAEGWAMAWLSGL